MELLYGKREAILRGEILSGDVVNELYEYLGPHFDIPSPPEILIAPSAQIMDTYFFTSQEIKAIYLFNNDKNLLNFSSLFSLIDQFFISCNLIF